MSKNIVVIGGGMAGTSAAYHLRKCGYGVTILEKSDRLGGRMKSLSTDGIVMEQGAGFVMNIYANTLRFLREEGLYDSLFENPSETPGVMRGGKIRFIGLRTALGTSLLSWKAKSKGLAFLVRVVRQWRSIDIQHPWKLDVYDDVSISDECSSAAGAEMYDYFVQPALTGTWYWPAEDVARTSLGVLLIAAKAILRGGTYNLHGGLKRIPEKAAEGSTVLLEHAVTKVERHLSGYAVTVSHDGTKSVLHADGIVCATTATVAARLFPDLDPKRRSFIESIRYSSVAYMGRTYRKIDMRGGVSIAIPSKEGSLVTGVTSGQDSDKGWVKISAAGKQLQGKDDAAILSALSTESQFVQGSVVTADAKPLSTSVWHWDEALPHMKKGYFKHLRSFVAEEESSDQPLAFAGDYIGGGFIEGAFTSGLQAAERLDAGFTTNS